MSRFNMTHTIKMEDFSADIDHDRKELNIHYRGINLELEDQFRADLDQVIQQLDLDDMQADILAETFWYNARKMALTNLLFGKQ